MRSFDCQVDLSGSSYAQAASHACVLAEESGGGVIEERRKTAARRPRIHARSLAPSAYHLGVPLSGVPRCLEDSGTFGGKRGGAEAEARRGEDRGWAATAQPKSIFQFYQGKRAQMPIPHRLPRHSHAEQTFGAPDRAQKHWQAALKCFLPTRKPRLSICSK